ncbi:MAG: hypothetical protein ACLQLH_09660 [Terracidiphilus sp.]
MRSIFRNVAPLLLAAAVASPLFMTGCAEPVYDPYYHDYHYWSAEDPHYRQWEHDTHRDHRDFDKRSDSEKKEYWDSRHSQH